MNRRDKAIYTQTITFFLAGMLLFGTIAGLSAQEKSCVVKHPALSGKYSGDCRNGFADGRGVAEGTDKYFGQFRNGLPHGKGTYTWADGSYYIGQFQNGLKDGRGKLVNKDSTLTGFWKEDRYVGEKIISPYQITRSVSITRSTFKKLAGSGNYIRIRFTRGGVENIDIIDFSLAHDSGEQYRIGQSYGIQNSQFPLTIIVRFRAWNYFHSAQFEANFEFTINEPANWEVNVSY
ncbi:MAG: hypothetical protein GYA41_04735 [Bacteroidales bacterium]|nr:hypothetical protein [Bacteroidales bacterium]